MLTQVCTRSAPSSEGSSKEEGTGAVTTPTSATHTQLTAVLRSNLKASEVTLACKTHVVMGLPMTSFGSLIPYTTPCRVAQRASLVGK